MGTYNIPRNVKGEGRILFIFSVKSLITTCVGGGLGLVIYFLLSLCNFSSIGMIIAGIFAVIGYSIGMLKVPETNGLEITRKTGGENLDDIIIRYIKFKNKEKKIYIYTKEEEKNG